MRADHIARETRKDGHLGKIVQALESGLNLAQSGYKAPEAKYTLAANCLLFEHRVVVPPVLREAVLKDLHVAHLGVVKMKGLARSFVYWPGIDSDIERTARSCGECARNAAVPAKFNRHHWEYPNGPWERVHIDYAGPVADTMLLIIVDAYSKWVEVKTTNLTTTAATINLLDDLFAAYGAPITLVSDNGPQFTSAEFRSFLQKSGVKFHKLTAPYHPATNGQAERYVQTVKQALKAMGTVKSCLKVNINEFLRQYRKAPHSETGESPSKLFLGRNIRTRLDLVRPQDIRCRTSEKQRATFDATFRVFDAGQEVYFLSGNDRMDKWIPGVITTRLGDLHYEIDYNGKLIKRHVDQILQRKQGADSTHSGSKVTNGQDDSSRRLRYYGDTVTASGSQSGPVSIRRSSVSQESPGPQFSTPCVSPAQNRADSPTMPRRSARERRPPRRYSP